MSEEREQFDRLHSSELRDARDIANRLAVMIDRDFVQPSEVEGGFPPIESYVGKEDVGKVNGSRHVIFTFKYESAATVRLQLAGTFNSHLGDYQWEPVGNIYLIFPKSRYKDGKVKAEMVKLDLDTAFLRQKNWWQKPLPASELEPAFNKK